jgi:hypothetical protein
MRATSGSRHRIDSSTTDGWPGRRFPRPDCRLLEYQYFFVEYSEKEEISHIAAPL